MNKGIGLLVQHIVRRRFWVEHTSVWKKYQRQRDQAYITQTLEHALYWQRIEFKGNHLKGAVHAQRGKIDRANEYNDFAWLRFPVFDNK